MINHAARVQGEIADRFERVARERFQDISPHTAQQLIRRIDPRSNQQSHTQLDPNSLNNIFNHLFNILFKNIYYQVMTSSVKMQEISSPTW
jgi:hypothetical protein